VNQVTGSVQTRRAARYQRIIGLIAGEVLSVSHDAIIRRPQDRANDQALGARMNHAS
jgi:hypothetical protein